MPHAPVIGVVGGIASGKSLVSKILESLGAKRLDADRVGHAVLKEPEVVAALLERWGSAILAGDGQIDRQQVAARVFEPSAREELDFLEAVTHPRIATALGEEMAQAPAATIFVLDAALLLEARWSDMCRWIVFVDAPWPARLERARQRGWTAEQLRCRESQQLPLSEKRRRAHRTFSNDGSIDALTNQVTAWWQQIQSDLTNAPG
ncbi:MAG: dephospho-CoA kinase [Planctomycetota bacterium]|nr:dephospho-CoA kinase [Planctomycetota bacterium]MDA1180040.1 dephospho-CoA kinase [Planctomycetota bacterium]